jgi:hypothetical protein
MAVSSVMHEHREEKNDRQRNADEPEQRAFSERHGSLHSMFQRNLQFAGVTLVPYRTSLVPAGAVVIAFGVGGEDKGEATVSAAKESEFAASVAAAMKTAMPVQIDGGPSMASEDFGFLLQIWLGGRDEHKISDDHE